MAPSAIFQDPAGNPAGTRDREAAISTHASPGRPPATSHAAIEQAAFALFADRGFEATTVEDIAAKAGISRRTLFRYFPSKADIPWGRFDESLAGFRATLEMNDQLPLWQAVQRAVVAFNRFDPSALPQHRERMRLILATPSLQAHSVLMYEQWRMVIADYAGRRCAAHPMSALPQTVGHVSLALAISAYEQWLRTETTSIEDLLDATFQILSDVIGEDL